LAALELTKDITQEAFIKAVIHGPRLHSDDNIPGWIKWVARNTAIDFLRKWNNGHQIVGYIYDSTYTTCQNEVSVASEVETKVKFELLHLALSELKSDYKILLLLFYLCGKSYREISNELNLRESVVSQRLARARKKLLQHFLKK
jgi:RNA polymerase sigma-70 factor (ECF subfamily)